MESTRRRVKVYQLDEDGKWADKGTGHVTCSYVEQKGGICLLVTSEDDNTTLLESKIHNEDIYQKQQETLVVWSEPDLNIDLALSFQEPEGCTEIWDQIVNIQQRQNPDGMSEVELSQGDSDNENESPEETQKLPPANVANLSQILDTILATDTLMKKERFVKAVVEEDYIRKLLDLFSMCESMDDPAVMHLLFNIFKHLVLMNDTNLMEVMFSDDYMIPVLGALEYDPEVQEQQRTKHREFLTKSVIFKEVVPFNSPELVERIHQTFRMQYLKDVVLSRVLDDATFTTLNSLIFFNNLEIVCQLQSDTKFLAELFQKLQNPDTSTQDRKDLMLFLQELCSLAKNQQLAPRAAFHKSLNEQGLYDVFNTSLNDESTAIRMATTDIILLSMAHDPSLFRGYVTRQKPDHPLLRLIVQKFTSDRELGVKSQCAEILKLLIEEGPQEEPTIKDEFLNVFYQHILPLLMVPLKRKNIQQVNTTGDMSSGFVQNSICEILSYCIRHHGYRIKYFLLGNNVVKKVLKLLEHKETYLVLAAIRFLRAFVGAKDDFYSRHITKENLFAPVMEVFVKNGNRYNLLNSSILELVDFVRKENMSSLIQYIGDNFADTMRSVDYVDVFKNLLIRYDQMKEGPSRVESSISNGPRKSFKQMEEEEEDAYFRESDDEEEDKKPPNNNNNNNSTGSRALVDYEDDDEVVTTPKHEDSGSDSEKEKDKEKGIKQEQDQDQEQEKKIETEIKKEPTTPTKEIEGEKEAENGKREIEKEIEKSPQKRKDSPTTMEEDEPSPKKTRKTTTDLTPELDAATTTTSDTTTTTAPTTPPPITTAIPITPTLPNTAPLSPKSTSPIQEDKTPPISSSS